MQIKSTNGKFTISTINNYKVYQNSNRSKSTKIDEKFDIYLTAFDNATIDDIASTIFNDCFDWDPYGFPLFDWTLIFHVLVKTTIYRFELNPNRINCFQDVLISLFSQLE